ncbi:MAG: hypothetical protein JKX83_08525 [Pseudomonadales bacterium]|nr:hypothetical protein [Pseudomonadales bacterium]
MLIRILFIIVLIGAVLLLLKRSRNPTDQDGQEQDDSEQMVPCEHCAIHVPQSEAIKEGEHYFCSEIHVKLSKQDPREP